MEKLRSRNVEKHASLTKHLHVSNQIGSDLDDATDEKLQQFVIFRP